MRSFCWFRLHVYKGYVNINTEIYEGADMDQLKLLAIDGLKLILIIIPVIGIVWSVVRIKKKKEKGKPQLICSLALGVLIYLFLASHSTWIEYNDWWILNNDIAKIQSRYGKFDVEYSLCEGRRRAGYLIFSNNGPVMPDYLDYFYFMEYDTEGIVYRVYVKARPGG